MEYPVDETLTVHQAEDIYKSDDWWKSVVQYHFKDQTDSIETAIYLWHHDDDQGWKKKNKYVIKTLEAWEDDQAALEAVREASSDPKANDEFPVSDFYHVASGKTVFKTDSWWKGIVRIDQKGDYETEELIIYVWQLHDGKWRRRQKYAIKDNDDWEEERTVVARLLNENVAPKPSASKDSSAEAQSATTGDEMKLGLQGSKAANHLSDDLRGGW